MSGKRIDNVFLLLLYPREDETHKQALNGIKSGYFSGKWEYYMCEHDKDKNEDGSMKKAHTHVVLFTGRKQARSTIANVLGIGENYTSYVNDVEDELLYLTHKCPKGRDKHQYDDSEVETNSQVDYTTRAQAETSRYLTDEDRFDLLEEIFEELANESMTYATTRTVAKMARQKGIGQYAMRNHQYVDKALVEVNQAIGLRLEAMRGFEPVDECELPFTAESEEKKQ